MLLVPGKPQDESLFPAPWTVNWTASGLLCSIMTACGFVRQGAGSVA
jgi:hypothetical protein